ncbi:hypothetical protein MMA231_03293 [Asticcacaulis sp. MM231]|uniref:Yip1 family protein n=1 Tax=Asticcacaulis sp. MM231 TaxID=3157666 RepID=UPI0032D59579
MADDSVPPVQAPDPNPYANPKNPNNLIERVQAILLKPAATWDVIERETPDVKTLYTSYIMPLAAIGPVATAIGGIVFGGGLFRIVSAVLLYILSLILIYVVALIIDGLAPSFNGQKNFIQALKVAAYSSTAGWVAAVLSIHPGLGVIGSLLGLYGLYLMYLGLPKLMKNPADKTIVYMIVNAVVYFVLVLIMGAVIATFAGISALTTGGLAALAVNHAVVAPNVSKIDQAANHMEAAANQMAAQASAMENGQTTVKLADAGALLALLPPSLNGVARSDDRTQANTMGGMAVSTAEGTYRIGDGSLHLTVTDMGTMAGFGAMAAAVNINTSSSSATGYEKVTTQNGQMVTEEYDTQSKHGKYAVVSNGRITVEAEGDNVDMATLKSAVASIDLGRAQALTK